MSLKKKQKTAVEIGLWPLHTDPCMRLNTHTRVHAHLCSACVHEHSVES